MLYHTKPSNKLVSYRGGDLPDILRALEPSLSSLVLPFPLLPLFPPLPFFSSLCLPPSLPPHESLVTQLSRVTLIAIGYVTSLCFLCPRVVCLTFLGVT
jgi:hypothetical protein